LALGTSISQPPAPSRPIARGRAGPALLAQVLFSKYGLHLPLTRQNTVYAREGINLDVSTQADWVPGSKTEIAREWARKEEGDTLQKCQVTLRAVAGIAADPGFAGNYATFLRDMAYGEGPDFETAIGTPKLLVKLLEKEQT